MISVTLIKGNNQYAAAHYFSSGDDYYSKEHPGQWQGEGATLLGLSGPVAQAQLSRLFNGQLPNGETIQLTFDRTTNEKRMGLDLTFSAPKSLSMQALIGGDVAVTTAHDRAVTKALEKVERLAVARKKIKGKSMRERTGNMVIAKFRHELSRAKDPQLHTHAVILNMTRRSDGAWRALSNDEIFQVQLELDGVYKAELAKHLGEQGYELREVDNRGNFELAHISREQIEAFSTRGNTIEEHLHRQGKTRATATGLEKRTISMTTRAAKDPKPDLKALMQDWLARSRELGIDYGERSPLDGRNFAPPAVSSERGRNMEKGEAKVSTSERSRKASLTLSLPVDATPAALAVNHAIEHLSEREAAFGDSELYTAALEHAVSVGAGSDEVRAEMQLRIARGGLIPSVPMYRLAERVEHVPLSPIGWIAKLQDEAAWSYQRARDYVRGAIERGSLVSVETRYTTPSALKEERAVLAIERDGRGKVPPLMSADAVRQALEARTAARHRQLNPGQHDAVAMILTTTNRFVGIQGDAGTGKTTAVKAAVALIEQAGRVSLGEGQGFEDHTAQGPGWRTLALAPYGPQVKTLKLDGLEARTFASFLKTKDKKIDARTIVILDEAGVADTRNLLQLMRVVEKAGARLVMLGDTKQTEPIQSGKPFAQLQQEGMPTARISEIMRQREKELKRAVEHTAAGRPSLSIDHISHVEVQKEPGHRHRAISNDFCALPPEQRNDTLIVVGTNRARRQINAMVRETLELAGKGREIEILVRVDTTKAQRRYAPSYAPGSVVVPEVDYKQAGLVRGEHYVVQEVRNGNALVLQRSDGTTITVTPRKLPKLSMYRFEHAEMSVGDVVRIGRQDPALDLATGDRMRVVGVIGPLLQLESIEKDGKLPHRVELLANKPLHVDHAYSSTVHSSQGLTSQCTLMSIDTKSRTTSFNLYYVAISRASHVARLYTNSLKELPEAISRVYDKTTALAIQRQREQERSRRMAQPRAGVAEGMKAPQLEKHMARRSGPSAGIDGLS